MIRGGLGERVAVVLRAATTTGVPGHEVETTDDTRVVVTNGLKCCLDVGVFGME